MLHIHSLPVSNEDLMLGGHDGISYCRHVSLSIHIPGEGGREGGGEGRGEGGREEGRNGEKEILIQKLPWISRVVYR